MGNRSVSVEAISKTYEPSPRWLRALVRTAIEEPVTALDNVTFSIGAGQICAVIGPNGAGKSTLFRILTGLTTASSGRVEVLGMDPATEGHRLRRRIGFMPADDRTLFLRHTCRENLRFHGRLQGMEEPDLGLRVDEMLELVGLYRARDRVGFALSSGMRSRLMFARAVLHEPQVLILDEPTGAIDPVSALDLLERIQEVCADRGIAALISSHRVEEIEALRDNVLLLDRGRVVYWGDLDSVRKTWERRQYDIEFSDTEARDTALMRLKSADAIEIATAGPNSIGLSSDDESALGLALSRLESVTRSIRAIETRQMSLSELLRKVLSTSSSDSDGSL